MDNKDVLITQEEKKNNLIYYKNIIDKLLNVLEQCDYPKQLIEKWNPLTQLYNQSKNKEEIEKDFNVSASGKYKDDFLPVDKLAYHLQISTSLLNKSLAQYRNERFMTDESLKKFERLLGLVNDELTLTKPSFADILNKKYHDFHAIYIDGKYESFYNIELNIDIMTKFLRQNEYDCYRLVSENFFYFRIDELLTRQFYAIDNTWKKIIEVLLLKLENLVEIKEDEYYKELRNLSMENDNIVSKHMEAFKQDYINMETISIRHNLELKRKMEQNKITILTKKLNINEESQKDIKAQLSLITTNNFEKQEIKSNLEKLLKRLQTDAINLKEGIDKSEKVKAKLDNNINNIEEKIIRSIDFNWKNILFNIFWSYNKDNDYKFCMHHFELLNDKNRILYKIELYLNNKPLDSKDTIVNNIYSMICNILDTGYIEYRRKQLS